MKRYFLIFLGLSFLFPFLLLKYLPKKAFVEGLVGQPQNLDPLVRTESEEIDSTIEELLYRSLFKYDWQGNLVGDLVEDFQVSEDGRKYHFSLFGDQYWHDGKKVTTADVVFTLRRDPSFATSEIEAVTDLEFEIILKDPFSPLLDALTRKVSPFHLRDVQKPLQPVGNGPYRFSKISWEGNFVRDFILSSVREDAAIQTFVFRFFEREEELVSTAWLGQLDGFLLNGGFDHPSFGKTELALYGRYFALFINQKTSNLLLSDQTFRSFLRKATPFAEISQGLGVPVNGPLSGSWGQDSSLSFLDYDPSLSKKFSGGITLIYLESEEHKKAVEKISQSWREKLGVEVLLEPKKFLEIKNEVLPGKNFEILLFGQEVRRDPDRYLYWHSTQDDPPGLNITSYQDLRGDRALEEGRKTSDQALRVMHYQNFQRLFWEDNPAVFLYHPTLNYFVKKSWSFPIPSQIFLPWERFKHLL